MITRCPECSTLFRVVADQLKISEGWVRCGQCSHVFDGTANLQHEAAHAAPLVTALPDEASNIHDELAAFDLNDEAPTRPVKEPDLAPLVPELQSGADVATALIGPEPEEAADAGVLPWRAQTELEVPSAPVSFLHSSERRSIWSRPGVRWLLALSSLALSLALTLQVLVHERDRIAATWPDVKPLLQTLCQGLGCAIAPLKAIESITVDSSSFDRVRADVYRLQIAIKNTAHTELALPALELTLTDTRDAAVLRRVLLPADFKTPVRSIAAGADWSGVLTVSVAGVASPARIAGYRVLAFYPQ